MISEELLSVPQSIQIPIEFFPPGVHISDNSAGQFVYFDTDFDDAVLNSNNVEFWEPYIKNVSNYLKKQYPNEIKGNDQSKFNTLVEGFSTYLCTQWKTLHSITTMQHDFAREGDLASMEEMNDLESPISFPDQYTRFSIKAYLTGELSKKFERVHPQYKRVSLTEERLAIEAQIEDAEKVRIKVNDSETIKNLGFNELLKNKIYKELNLKGESELINIFMNSSDTIPSWIAQLSLD